MRMRIPAEAFDGTWDQRVTAAIAQLPARGGIVDCTGLSGAQQFTATLAITRPYVTIVADQMNCAMGSNELYVAPGAHGFQLLGQGSFVSLGPPIGDYGTVFTYTGNASAMTIGGAPPQPSTRYIRLADIGFQLAGAGCDAKGLTINQCLFGSIDRVAVNMGIAAGGCTGGPSNNQVGMRIDGAGPPGGYTAYMQITNPYISNGNFGIRFAGVAPNGANSNQVIGGLITGAHPTAVTYGISFDSGQQNTIIGVDIENCTEALTFPPASSDGNYIVARVEGNLVDCNLSAGSSKDNTIHLMGGTGTLFNGGTGNMVIRDGYYLSTNPPFRVKNAVDGAGAAAGTLLNAPRSGNPTKWYAIDDNGTTRYIPAW